MGVTRSSAASVLEAKKKFDEALTSYVGICFEHKAQTPSSSGCRIWRQQVDAWRCLVSPCSLGPVKWSR